MNIASPWTITWDYTGTPLVTASDELTTGEWSAAQILNLALLS